jgi:MFS family permease
MKHAKRSKCLSCITDDRKFAFLMTLNFVVGIPYSTPGAFIPTMAKAHGLDEADTGLILSCYAFGLILMSMIAGKFMHNWNKRKALMISFFGLILCLILFSILDLANSNIVFKLIGITARLCQGLSCGVLYSIIYSIIPNLYPESTQRKFALMGIAAGLGNSSGPLFGSFFFRLLGFSAPFLLSAVLLLIFLIAISKSDISSYCPKEKTGVSEKDDYNNDDIVAARQETAQIPKSAEVTKIEIEKVPNKNDLSYASLFKNRRMVISFMTFILMATSYSILSPFFSIHLKEVFDIDPSGASLILSVCMLCYSSPSFLTDYLIIKKIDRRFYIIFGILGQTVAIAFISGAFSIPSLLAFLIMGLCLLGLSTFFSNIPCIPELIDICRESHPSGDIAIIRDFSSGIFNCFWGLSEFIGPLLGGTLSQNFGVKIAMEIYISVVLGVLLFYVIFGKGYLGIINVYYSIKNPINYEVATSHETANSEV